MSYESSSAQSNQQIRDEHRIKVLEGALYEIRRIAVAEYAQGGSWYSYWWAQVDRIAIEALEQK